MTGGSRKAFFWNGTSLVAIPTPDGVNSEAYRINEAGQVIGMMGSVGFLYDSESGKVITLSGGRPAEISDTGTVIVNGRTAVLWSFDPDRDDDGIENSIDGTYDESTSTYTDYSSDPAQNIHFSDKHAPYNGTISGKILDRGGVTLKLTYNPADTITSTPASVSISAIGSTGALPATLEWYCAGTRYQQTINPGETRTACGSIRTKVVSGAPVQTKLSNGTTITLSVGSDAKVESTLSGFTMDVYEAGPTAAPTATTSDGTTLEVAVGSSIKVSSDDEGNVSIASLNEGSTVTVNGTTTTLTQGQSINPPVIAAISMRPYDSDLVPVGTTVSASTSFTDPESNGSYSASWNWDANPQSADAPSMMNSGTVGPLGEDGSYPVSGEFTYTAPGVYTVRLTVESKGRRARQSYRYIVVYDPSAGFVTGGGWIDSPLGACRFEACTVDTTGKANFGFVSKYKPGTSTLTGKTEFQKAGNLNFHSASYDWLVVPGDQAKYKGTGTINGTGTYGFMLTSFDADVNPKDSHTQDGFRIVIWDKNDSDKVVYDNLAALAAVEDDYRTQPISGGSIKIHKK